MKNIKPIYLMCDEGVTESQLKAVRTGIQKVISLAGMENYIQVYNFGVWRFNGWKQGNSLTPYNSIDWYMQEGKRLSERANQLHGGAIIRSIYAEPWQRKCPHYDIMVFSHDIYDVGTNFVIGLAVPGIATVISTARFARLQEPRQSQCIQTEIIHELGHVFGLIPNQRQTNIEMSLGKHCTNTCTMRQGLRVPDDWIKITQDRIQNGNFCFCPTCIGDLQNFFR